MASSEVLTTGEVLSGERLAGETQAGIKTSYVCAAVILIASLIYVGCLISPPSLMDDVDAVWAQIARNMLTSHDWVTAHVDGVADFEKPPFVYWAIAASYRVFGVHDWSARIPIALSAIGLAWLTTAFGIWAFGKRAGFYAGACIATCVGLWLFTRILIADVMLTLSVALSMWAFARALDDDEPHPRLWAAVLAASFGVGLLIKSLIAVIFPAGAALVYLALTHQLFSAKTWKRLHPVSGLFIMLAIAAPWHVLAALRNPPYFSFALRGGPGQYHGFLWFVFVNEQLLRFLNLRYPRDYTSVSRPTFWLLHLAWLFPWSVYLPAIAKLSFKPVDRAGRTRLLVLCWVGFVLAFLTFSTTQEYYSMPCYPAFALLIGAAMAMDSAWIRGGTRVLTGIAAVAAVAVFTIFVLVRHIPTPGDISSALIQHPKLYTLSLGHMGDLTLDSFAYLRAPLFLAGIAFLVGALGTIRATTWRACLSMALMMVLFFQAARLAMVAFDPYLSSRPLAEALMQEPPGKLITQGHYFPLSSIFFYTNRDGLLFSNRRVNLEYGSYAPGAVQPFIDDSQFQRLWGNPERYYLVAFDTALPRYEELVGRENLHALAESGGKVLLTNEPVSGNAELTLPASPSPGN